jgi:5,10-methenyltetrahydromethanopterin hydrogenase
MLSNTDRERRHEARLAQINRVQVVVGQGDRARVDHEGTLIERARLRCEEVAAHDATERGLAAFARLLRVAEEERMTDAGRHVLAFLAALRDGLPLPVDALRVAAPAIGSDMLAVLDAFRYARLDLAGQVEGGSERLAKALRRRAADLSAGIPAPPSD